MVWEGKKHERRGKRKLKADLRAVGAAIAAGRGGKEGIGKKQRGGW